MSQSRGDNVAISLQEISKGKNSTCSKENGTCCTNRLIKTWFSFIMWPIHEATYLLYIAIVHVCVYIYKVIFTFIMWNRKYVIRNGKYIRKICGNSNHLGWHLGTLFGFHEADCYKGLERTMTICYWVKRNKIRCFHKEQDKLLWLTREPLNRHLNQSWHSTLIGQKRSKVSAVAKDLCR